MTSSCRQLARGVQAESVRLIHESSQGAARPEPISSVAGACADVPVEHALEHRDRMTPSPAPTPRQNGITGASS
jgi:hypothetical protein